MYYQTGIQSTPLMNGTQYGNAQASFQKPANPYPMSSFPGLQGMTNPAVQGQLNQQFGDLSHQANQVAGLQFDRNYATANAGHMLDTQTAQAQSGLQGYGNFVDQQGQLYGQQNQQRQSLLQMLIPYMQG